MASDASIYGLIKQAPAGPGPMEQYGQVMQLRNLVDQGAMSKLQREQAERGVEEEGRIRDLFARGNVTPEQLMAVSPAKGMAFQKSRLEAQKAEADLAKTKSETMAKNIGIMRDLTAQAKSDADMPMIRENALRLFGPEVADKVPQTFTPEWQMQGILTADKLLERLKPDVRPVNAGGQTVFRETNPNAPGYSAAPIQHTRTPDSLATQAQDVWDSERGVFVPRPTRPTMGGSVMAGQPAAQTAPQAPAAQPGAPIKPPGLPPRAGDIASIREKFNDLPEVKNYRAAVPIFESAFTAPDTKSGDIQFAYTIGKIFDPNSVVREGELKLVGEAANVMQKYLGELQSLTNGRGRLTPQTRSELMAAAESRVNELKAAHDAARVPYERQAEAQGLPKDQIFVDLPRKKRSDKGRPALGDIFK